MMDELKNTIEKVNNLQETENGALGYSTTGKNLVDLNFRVPSKHNNVSEKDIENFISSLKENPVDTIKWLFYLRDVREGLGERDSFVTLFGILCSKNVKLASKVLPLIPEYGRWKDVVDILEVVNDDYISSTIYDMISLQLKEDCMNFSQKKPISLLAKWLPSINASQKARKLALRICRNTELYPEIYRKILSKLRKYIDVTEIKTCSGNWKEIDYNKVSSNANARYLKSFLKHDRERREKYLDSLSKGVSGVKMNAKNLYPYEIYVKYRDRNHYYPVIKDDSIEALWSNLKNCENIGNTICVVDGSGSMETHLSNSVMAIDVARSLGVFFAERCSGEFHNQAIEFSSTPHYIDLSSCHSLADKINVMKEYDDCSNTNVEKVFDLILETAVNNDLPQDELPQRILIISDMEFDNIANYHNESDNNVYYRSLFETIGKKWNRLGYKMPQLIFWNVASRTQTIPIMENEYGLTLVSGFSINAIKAVLTGETNPWKALKSVLDSPRYDMIAEVLA